MGHLQLRLRLFLSLAFSWLKAWGLKLWLPVRFSPIVVCGNGSVLFLVESDLRFEWVIIARCIFEGFLDDGWGDFWVMYGIVCFPFFRFDEIGDDFVAFDFCSVCCLVRQVEMMYIIEEIRRRILEFLRINPSPPPVISPEGREFITCLMSRNGPKVRDVHLPFIILLPARHDSNTFSILQFSVFKQCRFWSEADSFTRGKWHISILHSRADMPISSILDKKLRYASAAATPCYFHPFSHSCTIQQTPRSSAKWPIYLSPICPTNLTIVSQRL